MRRAEETHTEIMRLFDDILHNISQLKRERSSQRGRDSSCRNAEEFYGSKVRERKLELLAFEGESGKNEPSLVEMKKAMTLVEKRRSPGFNKIEEKVEEKPGLADVYTDPEKPKKIEADGGSEEEPEEQRAYENEEDEGEGGDLSLEKEAADARSEEVVDGGTKMESKYVLGKTSTHEALIGHHGELAKNGNIEMEAEMSAIPPQARSSYYKEEGARSGLRRLGPSIAITGQAQVIMQPLFFLQIGLGAWICKWGK